MKRPDVLFDIGREQAAGVYLLWLDGECVYIGQTQNIFQRVCNHWKRKFDRVAFIPVVHWSDRLNLEEEMIRQIKPKWNVNLVGGRISEDRRCKQHGARGRELSGDKFANHRLLMNIAIEKAGTQKNLADLLGVPPPTVSHWRRTGDIPPDHKQKIEQYVSLSVDIIASFISENAGPDPWKDREYFDGDWEENAA